MSVPIDSRAFGRSCIHLAVAGVEFFVGQSTAKPDHVAKPGFILYVGMPDADTRAKIRNCLSFCFGTYLLYLGNAKFDLDWAPVAFDAKSGHALVKESSRLSGWQPAPLDAQYDREVSSELLQRMMTSLYKNYEKYELQSSFWSYWHAIAAPVHMKAVHFGAAIEALQNKFLKTVPGVGRRIVESNADWSELCGDISTLIDRTDLPEDVKNLLVNKMKNLNFAPQSVVVQRFSEALGITFGELEKTVWGNRNRAAHGGTVKADKGHQLVRENKVLHVMMNRIFLALGGGADTYYDYYTLGRPTRQLRDAIPGDKI